MYRHSARLLLVVAVKFLRCSDMLMHCNVVVGVFCMVSRVQLLRCSDGFVNLVDRLFCVVTWMWLSGCYHVLGGYLLVLIHPRVNVILWDY